MLTNASLPARTDPDYVRLSTPLLWSHDLVTFIGDMLGIVWKLDPIDNV